MCRCHGWVQRTYPVLAHAAMDQTEAPAPGLWQTRTFREAASPPSLQARQTKSCVRLPVWACSGHLECRANLGSERAPHDRQQAEAR